MGLCCHFQISQPRDRTARNIVHNELFNNLLTWSDLVTSFPTVENAMSRTALISVVLLSMSFLVSAADDIGTIKTSKGVAHIERDGARSPATVGSTVMVSDSIVTEKNGIVGLTLKDNTRLTAGPNTRLDLNKFSFDTTTHAGTMDASVKRGSLAVISGKIAKTNPEAVRFSTPTVTLGVRGTEFIIDAGN